MALTPRFNGTAPVKARKLGKHRFQFVWMDWLQWDRAGEGAETQIRLQMTAIPLLLQWDRAGEGAETFQASRSSSLLNSCFNGTAPVKARKRQLRNRTAALIELLQWDRAGEGAETLIAVPVACWVVRLQWDRAGEGAETPPFAIPARSDLDLLQWDRAGEGAETRLSFANPGEFERLQWDRAGEGAETLHRGGRHQRR